MEPFAMRPEKALHALWSGIGWMVCMLGLLAGVVLLVVGPWQTIGVLLGAGAWLILMLIIQWYIAAFHASLEYVIGIDSVGAKKGVFWRKRTIIPYAMVTHVDVTQGPVQRIFGIGTVHVQTAGAGGQQAVRAEASLLGIRDLDGLKNAIMERVKACNRSEAPHPPAEATGQGQTPLPERVLEELIAIRKLLEEAREHE